MKHLNALLIAGTITLAGAQTAGAQTFPDPTLYGSISGGGQILDEDGRKISFGIWTNSLPGQQLQGELQVIFHKTSVLQDGQQFHGTISSVPEFRPPDDASCNAQAAVTFSGSLDGVPGYKVTFFLGDSGSPGNTNAAEPFDTVRIKLEVQSGNYVIYDTTMGDFERESKCTGIWRSGLDRGNIKLEVYQRL